MADEVFATSPSRAQIEQTLAPRLISEPLKGKLEKELADRERLASSGEAPSAERPYEVIIQINYKSPMGTGRARAWIIALLREMLGTAAEKALGRNLVDSIHPYVFATLTAPQIYELLKRDGETAIKLDKAETQAPTASTTPSFDESAAAGSDASSPASASPSPRQEGQTPIAHRHLRCIFCIWESQRIHPLTTESIRTVKARAAHNSFGAFGQKIVWAVLDSGVDENHPHFKLHDNLNLDAPLNGRSRSFTVDGTSWNQDAFGHGTHVAGIIAGELTPGVTSYSAIQSAGETGDGEYRLQPIETIKGMAPQAKLLILRVLDDNGDGDETALIQAIEFIQQLNDFGRHLVVHGVNISAGFPAHPTWYACGQTPLCIEINRLVKSGVAVVVAAGNSGHVITFLNQLSTTEAGQMLSINDPGNADLAITVGSTHRQSPHTFGVSYFSSKGPTSDGRRKPEVVAPGEKIVSCASSQRTANKTLPGLNGAAFDYIEDTGTSMAAPHVSGVLAAFLSINREFIGQPEKTKQLLMQSAMDLGRDPNFQGAGLVDLMKLMQSV